MDEASHRVGCHENSGDVSYQYALALGDFSGAKLRCFSLFTSCAKRVRGSTSTLRTRRQVRRPPPA